MSEVFKELEQEPLDGKKSEESTTAKEAKVKHVDRIALFPSCLIFKPPYGSVKQNFIVNIICLDRTVAFKIIGSKEIWKFFEAVPCTGVIPAKKSMPINFSLKSNFSQSADIFADSSAKVFKVLVMRWTDLLPFDSGFWKTREDSMDNIETITIGIQLNNKQGIPIDNETAVGPKLGALFPSTLVFRPPYGAAKLTSQFNLINITSEAIGFKVQGEVHIWKFFRTSPRKGIIKGGTSCQITMTMNADINVPDLNLPSTSYSIVVHVIKWIEATEFTEDLWKDMATADKLQTLKVSVELNTTKMDLVQGAITPSGILPKEAKKLPTQIPSAGKACKSPNDKVMIGDHTQKETESERPTMVEVTPKILDYGIPGINQTRTLNIKSISPVCLAFKVQTTKADFYKFQPDTGLILPGAKKEVIVERFDSLTIDHVLHNPPTTHKLFVVVVEWPNASGNFDQNLFNRLVVCQSGSNTVNIEINHDLKDVPADTIAAAEAAVKRKTSASPNTEIFIETEPSSFIFEPPFGEKKKRTLTITNKSDNVCAFKVQSGQNEIYNVVPGKGILRSKKSIAVQVELSEKFTEERRRKFVKDSHNLRVLAIRWPNSLKKFDGVMWNTLVNEKRKYLQKIVMCVKLE